jgi:hypothetical protein
MFKGGRPVKDTGCNNRNFIVLPEDTWSIIFSDPSRNTIIFSVNVTEVGLLKYRVVTPRLGISSFFFGTDSLPFRYPIGQQLRPRIISSIDL